jgi:hypothetical protein
VFLPNADQAFIDIRKLTEYCLDATHPVGGHKAVVFRSALGFTDQELGPDLLRRAILEGVQQNDAIRGRLDEHGQRYTVDFPVSHAQRTARIRTAWIVREGEDFPRLTTCYVIPN